MSTLATATATDAAAIYRDMCLRSGAGFPDVLVVDHDAKFASDVFRTFAKGMGSCLIVGLGGSAYHKNTNATRCARTRLHQRSQGRLRQPPHARRVRHQQRGLDPRCRPESPPGLLLH